MNPSSTRVTNVERLTDRLTFSTERAYRSAVDLVSSFPIAFDDAKALRKYTSVGGTHEVTLAVALSEVVAARRERNAKRATKGFVIGQRRQARQLRERGR